MAVKWVPRIGQVDGIAANAADGASSNDESSGGDRGGESGVTGACVVGSGATLLALLLLVLPAVMGKAVWRWWRR